VVRRCVWSRNIKNRCFIYIYDISCLRVNFPLHFLVFRFQTATIRWQGLRDSYIEHCKIARLFELDLEPGGTLRNVERNSTLDRYSGGGDLPLCAAYSSSFINKHFF